MLIRSQARTFNERRITLVIFPLLSLSRRLSFSLYIYPCPSWTYVTIFSAFLHRRKKTAVSHTFPLVHDLAISTALLSLFPCPHAILHLIDTADLFLRYAVSIVRFYNYWRIKSESSYSSLHSERVCEPIYSFTSTFSYSAFVPFLAVPSRSLFNSSLQRYCDWPLSYSIYCIIPHYAALCPIMMGLKKDDITLHENSGLSWSWRKSRSFNDTKNSLFDWINDFDVK